MTTWKTRGRDLVAGLGGLVCLAGLIAAEPEPAKTEPIVVVDGNGKELKIKGYKITAGTRHLGWLAPADKAPPEPKKDDKAPKDPPKGKAAPLPKPSAGPEALEFREEHSTNLREGIMTLVPLDRVRGLDYDADTQTVTLNVATSDKKEADDVLKGTTKYVGINKLTIEAEVDKGALGIAEVKFQGGVPKGGIRGVRFPSPKAGPAIAGRVATITSTDKKDKEPYKVTELRALYRLPDGSQKLLSTLMFKKTLKVNLDEVKKIVALDSGKSDAHEWTVTMADGEEHTLTLLLQTPDEKPAQLEGLLGTVPAGYKLFPIGTIHAIEIAAKAE